MNVTHKPSGSVLARSRPDLVGKDEAPQKPVEDAIPSIELGRITYLIPEFTWRELQTLLPLMRKCTKIKFEDLSADDMELLGDLMWFVASRTSTRDREGFDQLPMRIPEILRAIPIIARQAGMESGRGEAEAASSS
jgi:hypothetical protein